MAKNQIISGDYANYHFYNDGQQFGIRYAKSFTKFDIVQLNNETVAAYEVITEENKKSITSGIARGVVGGVLLGGVGAVVGAVSATSKTDYAVLIQFKDGKTSLGEMDKDTYQKFVMAANMPPALTSVEKLKKDIEEKQKSKPEKEKSKGFFGKLFG